MEAIGLDVPVTQGVTVSSTTSTDVGFSFVKTLRRFVGSNDIGLDLGTANTLLYSKWDGIVVNEPSIVVVNDKSGAPVSFGRAAKEQFWKDPSGLRLVRPIKNGVIANLQESVWLVEHLFKKTRGKCSFVRPKVVVGIPSGSTAAERLAVIEAVGTATCASEVRLVEEPLAAMIGLGLNVTPREAFFIIDIGGGSTEISITTWKGTITTSSIRIAGDYMDEAAQSYLRREFGIGLDIFEAERIKMAVGTAISSNYKKMAMAQGRDIISGDEVQVEMQDDIVLEALQASLDRISSAVCQVLDRATPEVIQDISNRGMFLSGGGSLLRGFSNFITDKTKIKTIRAQNPLTCVAQGLGAVAENYKTMQEFCVA